MTWQVRCLAGFLACFLAGAAHAQSNVTVENCSQTITTVPTQLVGNDRYRGVALQNNSGANMSFTWNGTGPWVLTPLGSFSASGQQFSNCPLIIVAGAGDVACYALY